MNKKKQLIFSTVLAVFLIAVSLTVYFIVEASRDAGAFVRVSVNGAAITDYPLNTDGEFELNGGTNILVIEDGKAYMKYADCPDGLCKNQGKIHLSGERIVCLPNKVLIEVFSDTEEIIPN